MEILRFSPVEPDTINYEIYDLKRRMLANLAWGADGSRSIAFCDDADRWTEVSGDEEALARCSEDFRSKIRELSDLLDEWDADLRRAGNIWHPDGLALDNTPSQGPDS